MVFSWPNLEEIESTTKQPLVHMGDDKTITIFGFEKPYDYPSYNQACVDSPYVARVEAFCRLHHIKYTKECAKPFENGRTNKLPFANIEGVMVDDSTQICDVLTKTQNLPTENNILTSDEQIQVKLIRKLLFGSFYYVCLHHMMETPEGREAFVEYKSKNLPPWPISQLVLSKLFQSQRIVLKGSGFGRLSHDEIVKIGKDDLLTLSHILGKENILFYFGKEQPTNIDADIYAFLATCFWDTTIGGAHPWIHEFVTNECPNLLDYANRMKQILYPELC